MEPSKVQVSLQHWTRDWCMVVWSHPQICCCRRLREQGEQGMLSPRVLCAIVCWALR